MDTPGGKQKMAIISEVGLYEAIFNSHKTEAKDFKEWVKAVLKALRQSSGIEGFQVFRMLDKEHQKEMMSNLQESIEAVRRPCRRDFVKANTMQTKLSQTVLVILKWSKKGK